MRSDTQVRRDLHRFAKTVNGIAQPCTIMSVHILLIEPTAYPRPNMKPVIPPETADRPEPRDHTQTDHQEGQQPRTNGRRLDCVVVVIVGTVTLSCVEPHQVYMTVNVARSCASSIGTYRETRPGYSSPACMPWLAR